MESQESTMENTELFHLYSTKNGEILFRYAARMGDSVTVKEALKNGVIVDAKVRKYPIIRLCCVI